MEFGGDCRFALGIPGALLAPLFCESIVEILVDVGEIEIWRNFKLAILLRLLKGRLLTALSLSSKDVGESWFPVEGEEDFWIFRGSRKSQVLVNQRSMRKYTIRICIKLHSFGEFIGRCQDLTKVVRACRGKKSRKEI